MLVALGDLSIVHSSLAQEGRFYACFQSCVKTGTGSPKVLCAPGTHHLLAQLAAQHLAPRTRHLGLQTLPDPGPRPSHTVL